MRRERYRKLARAVVVRAALDYVILRFPRASSIDLADWLRSEHKYAKPTRSAMTAWRRKQVAAIKYFFDDCGRDLAIQGGCRDVIEKARGELNRNHVWQVFQRRKPVSKRRCTLQQSEGSCPWGGDIGNARRVTQKESR